MRGESLVEKRKKKKRRRKPGGERGVDGKEEYKKMDIKEETQIGT